MLLGIILILLGIIGATAIFAYIIIDEKKRKREMAMRKKKARLKKKKMQERKARELAQSKALEDDVKIYTPTRSGGFNLENLTHAN